MPTIPLYTSKTSPSNDDLFIMEDSVSHSTKKIKRRDILAGTPLPVNTVDAQALQDDSIPNRAIPDREIQPIKLSLDIYSTTSTASLVPANKHNFITSLATAIVIGEPTSALKVSGQPIIIRIKDNGTARGITYNAIYRAVGVTLPTATVANKTYYIAGMWNEADSKVDIIAVARQA